MRHGETSCTQQSIPRCQQSKQYAKLCADVSAEVIGSLPAQADGRLEMFTPLELVRAHCLILMK